MRDVSAYLEQHQNDHLQQLCELLRIPSVSSDRRCREEMDRAAQWLEDRLATAGCTRVERFATPGHPIVYGEWLGAPGRPTLLVYGHYDVQPPEPLEQWQSPPFEPTIREDRVFARGASDDKGQLLIYVNALEGHLRTNGCCPVNVKLLLEGEEEIGSSSLIPFVRAQRRRLACDAVAISDTAMFGRGQPSVTHGLRGLVYLEIELVGTRRDLHSGTFGGAVINPAGALVQMLASLKDARGRVRVPEFYRDVRRLSPAERRAIESLPHRDGAFRRELGAPALFGEAGYSTLERLWARPTLDINGIWSGFTGEGPKTVIPAQAQAKISMRLVPDQSPRHIVGAVQRHLRRVAPAAVRLKTRTLHDCAAWWTPIDQPMLRAAARALERAFGRPSLFTREGGSIPIVGEFARLLGVPCLLLGMGLSDDNLHAPNEKLDLENYRAGSRAAAFLMEELAAVCPPQPRTRSPQPR